MCILRHTLDIILYSEKLSRILAFFAKVYLAKNLKSFIRESLSREILLIFQFAKVYPVNSEVFSANDFHFFCIIKIDPYFS